MGKIVRFRDGARHLPDFLAALADEDSYPDLTFQEWMEQSANKQLEGQVMSKAIGSLVQSHFAK